MPDRKRCRRTRRRLRDAPDRRIRVAETTWLCPVGGARALQSERLGLGKVSAPNASGGRDPITAGITLRAARESAGHLLPRVASSAGIGTFWQDVVSWLTRTDATEHVLGPAHQQPASLVALVRAGGQPVLDSGRDTLANADNVNHRGTARRTAVVPCTSSTPARRASAQAWSPRQISTMRANVVVTVTVTG